MTMWKPQMKAVCVDDSNRNKRFERPPLKAGSIYRVRGVSTCSGCGRISLDVGIGLGITLSPPMCSCGTRDTCRWAWLVCASRFRPLLGDEQEALDRIEEEVKETELIPESA